MMKTLLLSVTFVLLIYQGAFSQNPFLVSDINHQPLTAAPDYYGSLNVALGKLFFDATDDLGLGLYNSEGIQSGARFITNSTSLLTTESPSAIEFKNAFYFAGSKDFGLWKTDGTEAGTSEVSTVPLTIYVQGPANNFFTISDNLLFYSAGTDETGAELWESDGTINGTSLVKDINPGVAGSYPVFITAFENKIIFSATSLENGTELYISDGTANGTTLLKDIRAGSVGSYPSYLVLYAGEIYFLANDGIHGTSLWKTDGTEEGTILVKDFDPTSTTEFAENMCVLNGKLLLYASTTAHGEEPWISDGTSEGTYLLDDINPGKSSSSIGYPPAPFFIFNNEAYFTSFVNPNNEELYKTDGTISGTQKIAELDAQNFAALPDGKFIFTTSTTYQSDLWVSDGTSAGTDSIGIHFFTNQELLDFTSFDSSVFFIARDANGSLTDTKLCYTDGTIEGTQQLQIATNETYSSSPSNMIKLSEGNYVFKANDGIHGTELWQTNGIHSAILLKDIVPGKNSSNIQFCPRSENGIAYFSSAERIIDGYYTGYKLWKTDGTPHGTQIVQNCHPLFDTYYGFAFLNGILYFVNENGYSYELWRSDGTQSGTYRVKKINTSGNDAVGYITQAGNFLYFSAYNTINGQELWKSDGTADGTVLVKDIYPGSSGSHPQFLVSFNNKLFFEADDGTHGYELWTSDGTANGTFLLKDLNPGIDDSHPQNFTISNQVLFFSATADATGNELYKTDGTTDGTMIVRDINEGIYSSSPSYFTDVNGLLFFRAWNSNGNFQNLVKSDGTSEGTVRVADFNFDQDVAIGNFMSVNDDLYFVVTDYSTGDVSVWRSNGTACGTEKLDFFPGVNDEAAILLADSNQVYLSLNSPQFGEELFKYYSLPIRNCNETEETSKVSSLKEQSQKMQLNIYPVPASNVLQILLPGSDESSMVYVFDIAGQKVLVQKISTADHAIDVSSLSNGMYLLKVVTGNKSIQKLFEVQH